MAGAFGRRNAAAPCILSKAGRAKSSNVTWAETGFPGRPKTRCVAVRGENKGRSRLHANRRDVECDAEFAEGRLNEIEVPRGHATGKDYGVVAF